VSYQTARFFMALSHQWLPLALLLPVVFGCLATVAGKLKARSAAGEARYRRARGLWAASFVGLFVSLALAGAAVLHVGCAYSAGYQSDCILNMKRLGTAMLVYAQDYDERFPPPSRWAEAIAPKMDQAEESVPEQRGDPFRCPAATTVGSYGLNASMNGQLLADIMDPAAAVLLFEADAPSRSFAGGPKDLARQRHSRMPNVLYVDGHARGANKYVQQKLLWAPSARRSEE
jgi:prepilin-type processing-associated H-X9-DG protein